MSRKATLLLVFLVSICSCHYAFATAEMIEISCPSCGFRQEFVQGTSPSDRARNVQHIIVVCERSKTVRSIRIAINEKEPVRDEPLLARRYGTGTSRILNADLPKFLIPGNTCPLFPLAAYLEAGICPIDGQLGVQYSLMAPR